MEELKKEGFVFSWDNSFEIGGSVYQALIYVVLLQSKSEDYCKIERMVTGVPSFDKGGAKRVIRFDYHDSHQFVFLVKKDSSWKVTGISNKLSGEIKEPKEEEINWFE